MHCYCRTIIVYELLALGPYTLHSNCLRRGLHPPVLQAERSNRYTTVPHIYVLTTYFKAPWPIAGGQRCISGCVAGARAG